MPASQGQEEQEVTAADIALVSTLPEGAFQTSIERRPMALLVLEGRCCKPPPALSMSMRL